MEVSAFILSISLIYLLSPVFQHISAVIPNFAHDSVCNGDDSILPPFQLGDELAENALNTESTTAQAWRCLTFNVS